MAEPELPGDIVTFDLTEVERQVLASGLLMWGGPAFCTEEMAVAFGFLSVADMDDQIDRLLVGIRGNDGLSRRDWASIMLATSLAFADSLMGCQGDWSLISRLTQEETLTAFRSLQSNMFLLRRVIGNGIGTFVDASHKKY